MAGNDVFIPLFKKLDARWAEVEPDVKFKKIMMGSTLSVEGLVSEKSAYDPMDQVMWVDSGSASSLVFLVGTAAPAITPLVTAARSHVLGVRP